MFGAHVLKHWSKTQACVSLSSGEAELYSLVKGSTEAISMQHMMQELGVTVHVEVATDSAAAKGAVMRTGVGKMKHIDLNQMWVQERASKGTIGYRKIPRCQNVADFCNSSLECSRGADTHEQHGCDSRDG